MAHVRRGWQLANRGMHETVFRLCCDLQTEQFAGRAKNGRRIPRASRLSQVVFEAAAASRAVENFGKSSDSLHEHVRALGKLVNRLFALRLTHERFEKLPYGWRNEPRGRLAEVIVLDQFSRNIYRNTPLPFSQDPMALALAQEAIGIAAHKALSETERGVIFLPLMHSESALIHVWAESLYREFAPETNYEFELKHKAIIDRFGRYPHRNAILGRPSSLEEAEFLKKSGSSF